MQALGSVMTNKYSEVCVYFESLYRAVHACVRLPGALHLPRAFTSAHMRPLLCLSLPVYAPCYLRASLSFSRATLASATMGAMNSSTCPVCAITDIDQNSVSYKRRLIMRNPVMATTQRTDFTHRVCSNHLLVIHIAIVKCMMLAITLCNAVSSSTKEGRPLLPAHTQRPESSVASI